MARACFFPGEAVMPQDHFGVLATLDEVDRHGGNRLVSPGFPLPRVDEASRRIDFAVLAGYAMLFAGRRHHVDAVRPSDPRLHVGASHGHGTRRMPSLQFFRLRPRVVDALARRADGAADFDGFRLGDGVGHWVSWDSR